MKYIQRIKNSMDFCLYEYWWVTHKEIHGPRLVKVRIPPLNWPGIVWEFQLVDGREDEPLRYEDERDEWVWLDYIHEPDTELFDMRSN